MNLTDHDLDAFLKRLHLANTRRAWRDLARRAEQEEWTYHDFLALLVAEEIAHRQHTRLNRLVRRAHFPFFKTIDDFNFTYQSTVRLALLGSALAPDFVTEGRCLIFSGKPGRGKTHLAVAIAYRAIQNGFDALFVSDHLCIPLDDVEGSGGRYLDVLATLAWLAGVTDRIRVGVSVLVLPYRPRRLHHLPARLRILTPDFLHVRLVYPLRQTGDLLLSPPRNPVGNHRPLPSYRMCPLHRAPDFSLAPLPRGMISVVIVVIAFIIGTFP